MSSALAVQARRRSNANASPPSVKSTLLRAIESPRFQGFHRRERPSVGKVHPALAVDSARAGTSRWMATDGIVGKVPSGQPDHRATAKPAQMFEPLAPIPDSQRYPMDFTSTSSGLYRQKYPPNRLFPWTLPSHTIREINSS
jgi:hypothetical protein